MNSSDVMLLVGAGVLVLVAGVLAGMEASLGRVSRVQVEEMAREDKRGVERLQHVLTDPAPYLNLLLLLRVVAEMTATVLVTSALLDLIGSRAGAAALAAAVMTLVVYVLIGVAPRTLGIQHAPAIALRAARLSVSLSRLLGPVPRLLILLGNALTPGKGFREGPFASEAELRDLVDLAEERQLIEHGERDMIHGVFDLGDTLVREVMVPRTDLVSIEGTKSLKQAQSLALRSGFSRIPVVGENADDIIGLVYLKDVVRRLADTRMPTELMVVSDVMRAPTFVPDSKPVDELLRDLQAARVHLAVVIDEYGGTAGIVTIEDVLEEIVGEITDEYDREGPTVEEVDATTTRVTARLSVDDLAEIFGLDLGDTEDIETVGGLLAQRLGRVPIPGATVQVGDTTLVAEGTAGRRNTIGTVLVHHPPREGDDEPADADADAN